MYRFFLLVVVLFSFQTNAADPYNALRWNRANYEAKNNKIDKGNWFEWWYYKVVIPETKEAFYLCYGVVNPWDTKKTNSASNSFVSFGSFADKELFEKYYPLENFQASYDETKIAIAENKATDKFLSGSLTNDRGSVSWNLTLEKEWAFNAMGWSMGTNISKIFWYPAQASAKMNGTIDLNGKKFTLENAPAYQDRNWGSEFSEWWTWIVSNHFNNSPGTTLAAGGGKPKLIGGLKPEGVNIGLKHQGKEYVFRVNDLDKIHADIHFGLWEVWAENGRNERIEISATAPKSAFLALKFPTPEGKIYTDQEALKGNIKVRLYTRVPLSSKWKKIADLETDEGGIEYGSFNAEDLDRVFDTSINLL